MPKFPYRNYQAPNGEIGTRRLSNSCLKTD